MKRIGPELKMPKLKGSDVKVPPFLSDLYQDLRDRRLLPLIALIVVAIVATPFLLASGPSEVEAPARPLQPGGSATAKPSAKTLTVVKAAPGLRNYKKRLERRDPHNPFKQRYTGPVLKGSELNEQTVTAETSETSETTETRESSGGSTPSPGSTAAPDRLTFFSFAVDVRISKARTKPDGTVEKSGPENREKVIPPKPLPSEKAPVVTYMGIGGKNHLPLFLISDEVTAVFGEGDCISGTSHCQLIELEPEQPEIFEYGENKVRYKVTVLKVVPIVTGHS